MPLEDVTDSEQVKHAKWVRDVYYTLTRNFFFEMSYNTGEFAHRWESEKFLPLVSVASIGDIELRKDAIVAVSAMQEEYITTFNDALHDKWQSIMRRASGAGDLKRFNIFLEEEYYQILSDIITKHANMATLKKEDEAVIMQKIKEKWELEKLKSNFLNATPPDEFVSEQRAALQSCSSKPTITPCLRLPSSASGLSELPSSASGSGVGQLEPAGNMTKATMEQHLKKIMLLRCGVPKVDPTCNATEMEVEKRISLLHKLEASHLKETGAMINEKWTQKQVEDAGGRGTALCNTEPPQEFWEAIYYDVMFELYGHKLKNCQRQVVNGETYEKEPETPDAKRARGIHIAPTNDADFGMSGLFNRLGVDSPDAASSGQEMEVDFISARCVLDDALPSSRHKFQGYVQEFDHEPRSVSIKFLPGKTRSPIKSGNGEQERYVMNASMFDSTGPVSVTLWGELCGLFISLMQSGNPQVIVQLHNVRVTPVPRNAFNGGLLTSMNVLQSIDPIGTRSGTEVTIVPNATSPYMIKKHFRTAAIPCLSCGLSFGSK
jgi:hypothetical protein